MDEIVQAAMDKWPNVPVCYGWLRMDARGRWFVPSGPLVHPAVTQFIGRNYEKDDRGNYFFQNGPQRVFVELGAAPWVWSLVNGRGVCVWVDQFGVEIGPQIDLDISAIYSDEFGRVFMAIEDRLGVVDDRSLDGWSKFFVPNDDDTKSAGVWQQSADRSQVVEITTYAQLREKYRFVQNPVQNDTQGVEQ